MRDSEFLTDLLLVEDPARCHILIRLSKGFTDPGLREPKQGLLKRLPFLDPNQDRRGGAILRDRYLFSSPRGNVDELIEFVLDLRNRERKHRTRISLNSGLAKAHFTAESKINQALGRDHLASQRGWHVVVAHKGALEGPSAM
jgi:hypothetical protein